MVEVGETLIEEPVCPVLQVTVPPQALADKVALPPGFIWLGLAETLGGLGMALTVTVTLCWVVHPTREQVAE